MKHEKLILWLIFGATFALGQIIPGYVDIVAVPSAPGNPSATCLAGKPCNRLYVLGASGGTGATGTLSCKTTTGASCYIGAPPSKTISLNGNGSAIVTGSIGVFSEAEQPGTIYKVVTTGTATAGPANCSITVDIWKKAAALPTASDKISSSAPATLSTAQLSTDTTLTGWTKAVAAGDIFSASVATSTGCVTATVQIWWQ